MAASQQAQWPVKWSSVLVMSCFFPFHDFDTSTSTGTSTSTSTSTRVRALVPVHAVHWCTGVSVRPGMATQLAAHLEVHRLLSSGRLPGVRPGVATHATCMNQTEVNCDATVPPEGP